MVRSREDMEEVGECPGMGEEKWCPLARLEEHNLEWVVQRILLLLDLTTLHVARQVLHFTFSPNISSF